MKANIGITKEHLQSVATILSGILADEYVLYTKTRNAHWNIEGPDFYSVHKFLETQFKEIDIFIDSVAERIRSLGHYAPATLTSFLSLTHLTEMSRDKNNSQGFIKELMDDHESIIVHLRENINPLIEKYKDSGTSDFLTGIMEQHEKMSWFLRAHLK